MKVITIKVFSYCGDFTEEEQNIIVKDRGYDCYVDWIANSKEYLEESGYDNDIVANRLMQMGCRENEEVLINIDY